jgi:hypothetical protein
MRAVFVEKIRDRRLIQQIADDAGAMVGGRCIRMHWPVRGRPVPISVCSSTIWKY